MTPKVYMLTLGAIIEIERILDIDIEEILSLTCPPLS